MRSHAEDPREQMLIKVTKVEPLEGFRLRLEFSDGTQGVYGCSHILDSKGSMIEPLRDPDYFARVFLEYGAPTWPNGYDMAPWALQDELKAAGTLKRTNVDAG